MNNFLTSSFCKKYTCKIDFSVESSDTIGFTILLPERKLSFGVIEDAEERSLSLDFDPKGKLIKGVVDLELDYGTNGVRPREAELGNDFSILLTGQKIMAKSEYFSGGDLSLCLNILGNAQLKGSQAETRLLKTGSTISKTPYSVQCGQLGTKSGKRINRWLEIKVK